MHVLMSRDQQHANGSREHQEKSGTLWAHITSTLGLDLGPNSAESGVDSVFESTFGNHLPYLAYNLSALTELGSWKVGK